MLDLAEQVSILILLKRNYANLTAIDLLQSLTFIKLLTTLNAHLSSLRCLNSMLLSIHVPDECRSGYFIC